MFILPCEWHSSITVNWLFRNTLRKVKCHNWPWFGQSTTWVFPQWMWLCLPGFTVIQRLLWVEFITKPYLSTALKFHAIYLFITHVHCSDQNLKLVLTWIISSIGLTSKPSQEPQGALIRHRSWVKIQKCLIQKSVSL